MSRVKPTREILELGAGRTPTAEATQTIDIRDLDTIDHPNIDISEDTWPIETDTIDHVIGKNILEHINPQINRLTHVFEETDRVLKPGGTFRFELPHAGTISAYTDPTHQGTGGTTPRIQHYYHNHGCEHAYWHHLNWTVKAHAELSFPTLLRQSARLRTRIQRGAVSSALCKLPLVNGVVVIRGKTSDLVADGGHARRLAEQLRIAAEEDENEERAERLEHRASEIEDEQEDEEDCTEGGEA